MGQSFSFVDIIILALVTGFLVLRLRAVLGRRTGNEKPPQEAKRQDNDNVVPMPRRTDGDADEIQAPPRPSPSSTWGKAVGTVEPSAMQGLALIHQADPDFDDNRFMAGARAAFEMILSAYAKGDTKALRPLLADSVYNPFAHAIQDRQRRQETMVSELISFKTVTLTGADLTGSTAAVTMRFVTEQVLLIRDAQDQLIEGDPTQIDQVIDEWTFTRDITSRNPNWLLSATATPSA